MYLADNRIKELGADIFLLYVNIIFLNKIKVLRVKVNNEYGLL